MASKWTCKEDSPFARWVVECNGEYMGIIFRHKSTPYTYEYAIADQTYTPKAFPTVKRAMKAMRATLRWRRKTQRKAAGKPLDTQD